MALPAYLTLGWLPTQQLGIQLFGSYPIERWELGYAATVGNGQTKDGIGAQEGQARLASSANPCVLPEIGLL